MSGGLDLVTRSFTPEELGEVFPRSPLREVAFEVRFAPRLRVPAEIWRLQEQLVSQYPEVGKESTLQPNGALLDVSVFQSPAEFRIIKVSHQNFVIALTRYIKFEEFKEEVQKRTEQFCSIFEIDAFTRIGLRYVNEITVPRPELTALLTYLRPMLSFERFPLEMVEQFATEVRSHYRDHQVTVRSALLPGVLKTYMLDIDCHTNSPRPAADYRSLLDQFHDSAQRIFLDHITEEYKEVMRGQK